jgi:hypothetical protein
MLLKLHIVQRTGKFFPTAAAAWNATVQSFPARHGL